MSIEDLEPGQAMMVDWTAEEYLGDAQCESRSELWMLSKDPPRYHATVVAKSMPWPGSKEMDLGTLIHMAVLEPSRFLSTVTIKPNKPRGTRPKSTGPSDAAKFGLTPVDQWTAYAAHNESLEIFKRSGGWVISQAMAELVTDIATKVARHGFASDLLGLPGVNEQTIIWREPTTGLLCRVRLDSLRDLPDGARVITDLKSTHTPEPEAFGRSIEKLGYDFQAGFYTDAVQALDPAREVIYAIIAAGTSRPLQTSAAPWLHAPSIEVDGNTKQRWPI